MMIQTIEHFSQAHWLNVTEDEAPYNMTLEDLLAMHRTSKKKGWDWRFTA